VSDTQRVALVTGGNRGIGLEVCRGLARAGLRVILTGRDEAQLRQAQAGLQAEGLRVITIELDVTDRRMLDPPKDLNVSFIADWVQRKFGRLDVLINNAGVVPDTRAYGAMEDSILGMPRSALEQGMETHFHGPLALCRALLPVMRAGGYGRIVNVSTHMAALNEMSRGWPAYRISKLALNALTCMLADELRGSGILVNATTPGWVRTRMGGEQAPLEPAQGADTILWLATLPDDGPTGGFFENRKPRPW
jgi:NAD(P)-dependent dehydrogenase (short-subunit alcohol dehydrogenase family)